MQSLRSLLLFALFCAHPGTLWAASFVLDSSSQMLRTEVRDVLDALRASDSVEQTTAGTFTDSRQATYVIYYHAAAAQTTNISSDGTLLSMSGSGSGTTTRDVTSGSSIRHIGYSSMSVTVTALVPLFLDYDLTLISGDPAQGHSSIFSVTSGANTLFSRSGVTDTGQLTLAMGQTYVISVVSGGDYVTTSAATHNQTSSFNVGLSLYAVPEPGVAVAALLPLGGLLGATRRRRRALG